VRELGERLLQTIRKTGLLRAGDRVAAAVSGGADSVALLCLLLELREELGIVLSVAHVNHKLRGEESDDDERFVAQLAQQHGLELHLRAATIGRRDNQRERGDETTSTTSGIEAAARELRYQFFRELVGDRRVGKIATAHTLDDQAETILLRIFRGTGIRGLAGIHPRIVFEQEGLSFGEVVRPFLGFRRATLQQFLRESGQGWREDSSNQNIAFLRNRVRHRLLPLIAQEFGEAAIEHMSELAEIARAEEEHWTIDHAEIMAQPPALSTACLPLTALQAFPLASQRRVLRAWLEANAPGVSISFHLIEEALELAQTSTSEKSPRKKLELSRAWNLRLARQSGSREVHLLLETSHCRDGEAGESQVRDYQYTLHVPGAVAVPELHGRVAAEIVDVATVPDPERTQLLDIARVPIEILIRNWRPGDRYWPAHTAAERKVKELLSDRNVTGTQKKLWPVAAAEVSGLIWMRGFAVPEAHRAAPNATQAIWIRELGA
jgi:tRNA(Ile)-lysidine synthase